MGEAGRIRQLLSSIIESRSLRKGKTGGQGSSDEEPFEAAAHGNGSGARVDCASGTAAGA